MADANAQAPQDVANMANAAPAAAPTIVNPVDSFFDDYKTAVEADKARRPKARPRVAPPVAAPAPVERDIPKENGYKGKYARFNPEFRQDVYGGPTPPSHDFTGKPYPVQQPGSNIADTGGAIIEQGILGGQRKQREAQAPHVKAFEKAVAPPAPVKLPSFISAEKKPMNPKLDSVLAGMDGDRLETMGQEFASTYFKDGGASGYKDDELQQVYLGVQEHLRDRVKKGYKLKTMDEARLFEED